MPLSSLLTLLESENQPPTIAPNTPDANNFGSDTTPTLEFTGTDSESDDLSYEVEISDQSDFYPVSPEIRSSSQNSASSGSPSISEPAGAQVGDKIIILVSVNGQTTIDDNNGSTPFTEDINDYKPNTSNGNTVSVFSRIKQSGDPTTYNFTPGTTGRWAAIAICLKGGGYDVAPSTGNAANDDSASTGTINVPSITVGNNSIHIVACFWDTASIGTITTPSGYTLIQNANGGGEPLHASYKAFATGGATGAVTCQNTEFGAIIAFSFSVKSNTTVLLDKLSASDSGFANTVSGGDTDPFNSGEKVSFTVQAGDALSYGTYYWRARAKDPSGSDTWSSWTTARSFDVTSGGSGATATPDVATIVMSALAVTLVAGASIVAAVAGAVFSIPAPNPSGGTNIAPSVPSAVFSTQDPTVIGGANTIPVVAEATFSTQTLTQSGGGVTMPNVAEASFSAPVASASGGGGSVSATPLESSALFSVVSPSVSSGGTAQASTVSAVLSSISPSLSGSAAKSVAVSQLLASIPSQSVIGSGRASASVASVAFSLVPVVPSGGAAITTDISSSLFSTPTPAVTGGSNSCTVYPKTVVIGPYDLIFLPSSGKLAKRITGNLYLEL